MFVFFFFQNWTPRRNFPRGEVPGAVLLQRARPREVDPLPRNGAEAAGVPWQGLGQRQGISCSELDLEVQAEWDIEDMQYSGLMDHQGWDFEIF